MFQKEMLDYFQSKLKEIKYNYILALEKNDQDGIHDLRVDLKRLRAFFNLVESISGEFNSRKNFRDFRKIAKNTSVLRDSQVQQKNAEKMKNTLNLDITDYLTFLKKMEAEGIETFLNFAKTNPVKKLKKSKKIINEALKAITTVCAVTKVQGRIYNLRNELILLSSENDLKEEILHKVRIRSKETHYTFDIIQQCFHLFEDHDDFKKEIKKVHQILGKWHDYDVSVIYLNNFLQGYSNNSSSETYTQLKKYIQKEKETLRKNCRTALNEFGEKAAAFLFTL